MYADKCGATLPSICCVAASSNTEPAVDHFNAADVVVPIGDFIAGRLVRGHLPLERQMSCRTESPNQQLLFPAPAISLHAAPARVMQ
jgi:hypothetical protein